MQAARLYWVATAAGARNGVLRPSDIMDSALSTAEEKEAVSSPKTLLLFGPEWTSNSTSDKSLKCLFSRIKPPIFCRGGRCQGQVVHSSAM